MSTKQAEYQKKRFKLINQVKEVYGMLECPLCGNRDVFKMYKTKHHKLVQSFRTQNLDEWTSSNMQDNVYC